MTTKFKLSDGRTLEALDDMSYGIALRVGKEEFLLNRQEARALSDCLESYLNDEPELFSVAYFEKARGACRREATRQIIRERERARKREKAKKKEKGRWRRK